MYKIFQLIDTQQALRYEKKFYFEIIQADTLVDKIKTIDFYQAYPDRQVNSLYFDSPNLTSYFQSINGIYNRYKVRMRWYGKLYQPSIKTQLEIKYKQGELGGKQIHQLGKINLSTKQKINSSLVINHLDILKKQLIKKAPAPLKTIIKDLNPTLSTSYQRQYYQHYSLPVRLTIDTDLKTIFHKLNSDSINYQQNNFAQTQPHQVVEIKYSPHKEQELIANKIGQILPLELNQFSKYSLGIESSTY